MNEHNNGHMAIGKYAVWTSEVNVNDKPDLNEAFFIKRKRRPGPAGALRATLCGAEPLARDPARFCAPVLTYMDAVDVLDRLMLMCAMALDVPQD